MGGHSGVFYAAPGARINHSEMNIFSHSLWSCLLSNLGEILDMARRVMAIHSPALDFIMSENQLVEAGDKFPLNQRGNFPTVRMCFHRRQEAPC